MTCLSLNHIGEVLKITTERKSSALGSVDCLHFWAFGAVYTIRIVCTELSTMFCIHYSVPSYMYCVQLWTLDHDHVVTEPSRDAAIDNSGC